MRAAIWLRKLLLDIGYAFSLEPIKLHDATHMKSVMELDGESVSDEEFRLDPLQIFNDNLGTTQTINNPEATSQRSKHIDVRYLRIRQHVQRQQLRVSYLGTDFNVADFFTKALKNPKFSGFLKVIGMRELPPKTKAV